MKKKILITRQLQPVAEELLASRFDVVVNPQEKTLPREGLIEAVQTYDAILCMLDDRFDKEVLGCATRLKVLSNFAIGLDNIDLATAQSKGIAVCNLPDVVTESTADLTFALFLSLLRKIPEGQQYVKEGRWQGWEPNLLLGEELRGKTFGIIGFGRIGKAVARRAIGFGLNVLFSARRHMDVAEDLKEHVRQVSFSTLLQEIDYLSLHVPLTLETHHLITLDVMRQMQKRPVLINVARGAIVNTDDLVIALQEGIVRGAALDVTSPEPIAASHPLCRFNNCLIIPHLGSATVECRTLMAKRAAENIIANLKT